MGLIKAVLRILALVGKELVEVIRRPAAVFSLVLGPFLILAVFGLGYHGVTRDLQAIVVADPSLNLPTDPTQYETLQSRGIRIAQVTTDRAAAEAQLRAQDVDLVVIAPKDLETALQSGRQAELTIEMNSTDPVEANYAGFLTDYMVGTINREIYRIGAQQGQGYALQLGAKALASIPPEVIASPTKATLVNLAPSQPGIEAFFGPAALALVLQHMSVTLLALSIVRERTSGAMDLFRVSPVRATEIVLGKVIAFGLLGSLIAAISLALLVGVLHVPLLAPLGLVAIVVLLLLLASLGLGLLISVVSSSERQAVQLSLLVLLASMFFSGFVLRIDEFETPVQIAAYLLPVTHGISLLQDLMLRGQISHLWQLAALGAIGLVLLVTSWALLRREMRPA
jgi:ABC-2 type transport system permease protein